MKNLKKMSFEQLEKACAALETENSALRVEMEHLRARCTQYDRNLRIFSSPNVCVNDFINH